VCAHVSAQSKHRIEVYVQHFVPVGIWELVGGMASLDAAAVEQDVDLMAVGDDLLDQSGYRRAGCEVGRVDLGFATQGLDLFEGGLVRGVALNRV
jgi:hypothetical protein